jgi:hypothetical protein
MAHKNSVPLHFMKITILTVAGQHVELTDVQLNDTVGKVKDVLHQRLGIPPSQQILMFGGRPLPNDTTLEVARVPDQATIHMVNDLRGGQNAGAVETTAPHQFSAFTVVNY